MAKDPATNALSRSEELPPVEEPTVEDVLAQFPTASELKILRQNERYPTKYDYLTTLPVDQFSQEGVKQEFGGGNYRVQILGPKGQYQRQFQFSIDARFRPASVGTIQPGAGASELNELRGMVEKMAATVAQLAGVVMSGAAAPAPRVEPDPFALMDRMASIMQKLTPPQQGAGLPMIVDAFKQGMEIVRNVPGGNDGGGDSLVPMMNALQPLVGVIARNADLELERKRQRLVGPAALPATPTALPSPSVDPVTPATDPSPSTPAWVATVRPHLSLLLLQARAGADVAHWAPTVLDIMPDHVYAAVERMAQAPDFADRVLDALPEARGQEAWMRALLEEIRNILLPEETGGSDPGPG